ncbi:MAG: hypothetical protein ACRDPD_23155 [Streptosporangiaceae bacterium]
MNDRSITPLLPTGRTRYSDTAALNDIHALLTSADPGDGTLGDMALILGRAGRPLVPVRDIEVSATETALGWPVACIESGDTSVLVHQATDGTGLVVEIRAKTAAEHAALTVTLDGASIHAPHPVGCSPA